jgi:hypothetical protein
MTKLDRLVSIFVVSRVPGVPESKEFLRDAATNARLELFWATRGLDEVGMK